MISRFMKNTSLVTMKEEKEEKDGDSSHSPSSPTLPPEIFFEILTHVPLNDLLRRCRWVCRDWNALTYDFTFKQLHSQRTQSISGYLIQLVHRNRYHTSFLSASTSATSLDIGQTGNVRIEASSYQAQGLVCCMGLVRRKPPRYFVCKPATQQWKIIPSPNIRYHTAKMAMVVKKSHPLHYKIIRFSRSKKQQLCFRCEIFDSKNWMWRVCSEINLKASGFVPSPELLLYGSIHWLTFGKPKHIFAFDIDKENWRLISLPQPQLMSSLLEEDEVEVKNCDFQMQTKLVNCEGQLGLLYSTWSWIELWVMEDYLKETWKKKYKLSLEPLILAPWCSLLAMGSMDTILVRKFDELIWYNCNTRVSTQVMKIENPHVTSVHSIYPFNSDFLPL